MDALNEPPDATTLEEIETADIDALLRGDGLDRLHLHAPPGGVDAPAVLGVIRGIVQRLHTAGCRAAWIIVSGREAVGLCSFVRPPERGCAEIGYGIAESRRGRGHASRAVAAMCAAAHAQGLVALTAANAMSNHASARVLEKNGFVRTGSRVDAEDGEVVTWRKQLEGEANAP
jgi:RimJ/RimL family protein N-acetyltransferase